VEVRLAEGEDLEACLALDDTYTTSRTWQVDVTRGEPGANPFALNSSVTLGDWPLSVTFRPVKLPRARKVAGPAAASIRDGDEGAQMARLQSLMSSDLVLVAEQERPGLGPGNGSAPPLLCGYLGLTVVPGSGIGWISSLVVATSMRQQGIGSMLLAAARRWARYGQGRNVRAFMLELPTKNYPAVAFCRKEGFTFCGYTDYSFSNGDVVLLFVSPVVI
jgi:ribosomal protein S18 acetylase RimI-like enzyme